MSKPCCGSGPIKVDEEQCIPLSGDHAVAVAGHKFVNGQHFFMSGELGGSHPMTRSEYMKWSKGRAGYAVDPAKEWFVRMKKGPIPSEFKDLKK